MGIVFRQSVKSTIIVFIGAALGAIISYVYLFALSQRQLGLFQNVINQGAILQILLTIGTGSAIATFMPRYPMGDPRRKSLIGFAVILTIAANLLFALLYFTFKQYILGKYQVQDRAMLDQYFLWLPVLTCIWSLSSLYEMYLLSQTKAAVSAFMKEVVLRLCTLVLIGFLYYRLISFDVFIKAAILVYLLPALVFLYITNKKEGSPFAFSLGAFSKTEYKELARFSWYHLFTNASLNLMGFVDSLMLGALDKTGLSSLAIYRNAIFLTTIATMPYRAITAASFATLNETFISGDKKKLQDLFERSALNLFIASLGVSIVIICNLDNILLLIPNGYEEIKPLVLILMAGKLADMCTGLNSELISISKYYRFNLWVSVLLLLLTVVLNRLFIPIYGTYGAAAGSSIALFVFNFSKATFLKYKLGLQPFTKNTGLVLLATLPAIAVGYFLPYIFNPIIDAVIRSGIILLLFTYCLYRFKASGDLNTYISDIFKNKKLF